MTGRTYRRLTKAEISLLKHQNCLAEDWSRVEVADPFHAGRLYGVSFLGDVRLGVLEGSVRLEGGVERPSRIVRATLSNSTVGDGCVIEDIGGQYLS